MTTTEQRIEIGFNSQYFIDTERRYLAIKPQMNALAQALQQADVKPKDVDITSLLSNPRRELLSFQTEGFQMTAINLATLTAMNWGTYQGLIDVCEELGKSNEILSFHSYWILSNGEATVNLTKVERLKDSCRIYVESELEEQRYIIAKELADVLNKFQNTDLGHNRFTAFGEYDEFKSVLREVVEREGLQFVIKSTFIKK